MRIRTLAVSTAAALAATAAIAAPASAWAPADTATIKPGVQLVTDGAQCTANFIFRGGGATYIGMAAHCAGGGEATDTNGCTAPTKRLGTQVEIEGASRPGTLAYSSWNAMQAAGESHAGTCLGNDFALVRIDPADVPDVNPSVPFWGGPTGLTSSVPRGVPRGKVVSYGNSSLRLGLEQLRPKEGYKLSSSNGGWTHAVYTITPGIPGDSGSGFMDRQGRAFGVLSTLNILPEPASNGVSDLSRALAYMRGHGGPAATLVNGTVGFRGPILPG